MISCVEKKGGGWKHGCHLKLIARNKMVWSFGYFWSFLMLKKIVPFRGLFWKYLAIFYEIPTN